MKELNEILTEEFLDKEYAHAYADEFLNLKIATAIKVLREQREWTQEQLANKSGMKQSRVSLLENVNYSSWSLSTLKKLARAFDLTLDLDFKEFSSRIYDIANINKETLQRVPRQEDLEKQLQKQVAIAENGFALQFGIQPYRDDTNQILDFEYHKMAIEKRAEKASKSNGNKSKLNEFLAHSVLKAGEAEKMDSPLLDTEAIA